VVEWCRPAAPTNAGALEPAGVVREVDAVALTEHPDVARGEVGAVLATIRRLVLDELGGG
jgi:hypothetical protein